MNIQTFSPVSKLSSLTVERAVVWLRAQDQPYKTVKPSSLPASKYTLNTVSLDSPLIISEARERAEEMERYFISQGYQVNEWLLADEIVTPLNVPYKALWNVLRWVPVVGGVIVLAPHWAAILAYVWHVVQMVALGALVLFCAATFGCGVDPILLLSVTDEKGQTTWYRSSWWLHSSHGLPSAS